MTEIFLYENMTWPEVAGLDRATPLYIPLGFRPELPDLPREAAKSRKVGILPSIPFGWKGSGIEISRNLFKDFLQSLIGSIREDGFTNVKILTPKGISLSLGKLGIQSTKDAIKQDLIPVGQAGKVALVPIGHTEQHGLHLPLSTDSHCISAIAQGTAASIPEDCFAIPVFPYGVSTHRKSFAGTTSVTGRIFEDFWLAVIDELVAKGFNKIYLLSGHGGNVSYLGNVVKYAGNKYPHAFIATTWLYLNGPKGQAALNKLRQSKIGGMGHACELETSLILHLHPELVQMERVVDETDFISTPSYYQDWIEGGVLMANPPWEDDTSTGAYGAGSLGTAEKGMYWLQAAIEEKVDHVHEIIEQYQRRKAKRE